MLRPPRLDGPRPATTPSAPWRVQTSDTRFGSSILAREQSADAWKMQASSSCDDPVSERARTTTRLARPSTSRSNRRGLPMREAEGIDRITECRRRKS